MAKQKVKDPSKLYEFHLAHPNWSIAAVARLFHISRQRASKIIMRFKERRPKDEIITL